MKRDRNVYSVLFALHAMLAGSLLSRPVYALEEMQSVEALSSSENDVQTESGSIEDGNTQNARIDELLSQLEAAKTKAQQTADIHAKCESLCSEIDALASAIASAQSELKSLEKQMDELQAQIDAVPAEHETPSQEEDTQDPAEEDSFSEESMTSEQTAFPAPKETEDAQISMKETSPAETKTDEPGMEAAQSPSQTGARTAGTPSEPGQPAAPESKTASSAQREVLESRFQELMSAQSDLQKALSDLQSQKSGKEQELADLEAQLKFDAAPEQTPLPISKDMPGSTPNLHVLGVQSANAIQKAEYGEYGDALIREIDTLESTLRSLETLNVYRLYNPNSGEHFYTTTTRERESLVKAGWRYEGIGWMSSRQATSQPVYRLYNPNAGDHHYTLDQKERAALIGLGWKDEGIGWYGDPYGGVKILRSYNPNAKAGAHNFTDSEIEYGALDQIGWKSEGLSFNARFIYSKCAEQNYTVWYGPDDQKLSGEYRFNGSWYAFGEATGIPVIGLYTVPGTDHTRFYGKDGRHQGGEVQIGSDWYDFDTGSGLMKKEQLVEYDSDVIRYLGADGKAMRGTFSFANAVFTADQDGNILKTVLNGVPLYRQTDLRWAARRIRGLSFSATGCVPTVLASVISAADGAVPLPFDVGCMLADANLMNVNRAGAGGDGCVYIAKRYQISIEGNLSIERARKILREGGVLCCAMNPGIFTAPGYTHEIFVMNYDNGRVFVHDPYGYAADGWYSLETLYAQQSNDAWDRSSGGPIFGFFNKRIVRSTAG